MIRYSKQLAAFALIAGLVSPAFAKEPTRPAPAPQMVQKCTWISNPEIVCPKGQTLATRNNQCKAELVQRKVCKMVKAPA